MKEFKKLGNRTRTMIKNARIEKGKSQLALAYDLGYANASMISQVESGVSRMPPDKIIAFCDALDLKKEELIDAMILDYGNEIRGIAL